MYNIYIDHNWKPQNAIRWGDVVFATKRDAYEVCNRLNETDGTFIYTVRRMPNLDKPEKDRLELDSYRLIQPLRTRSKDIRANRKTAPDPFKDFID